MSMETILLGRWPTSSLAVEVADRPTPAPRALVAFRV